MAPEHLHGVAVVGRRSPTFRRANMLRDIHTCLDGRHECVLNTAQPQRVGATFISSIGFPMQDCDLVGHNAKQPINTDLIHHAGAPLPRNPAARIRAAATRQDRSCGSSTPTPHERWNPPRRAVSRTSPPGPRALMGRHSRRADRHRMAERHRKRAVLVRQNRRRCRCRNPDGMRPSRDCREGRRRWRRGPAAFATLPQYARRPRPPGDYLTRRRPMGSSDRPRHRVRNHHVSPTRLSVFARPPAPASAPPP